MDLEEFSERDICTKVILSALLDAGWTQDQFREEVNLTAGRVIVRGQIAQRLTNPDTKGGPKFADYVLFAKPFIPLAVIEAKRNRHELGDGMQQALEYAEMIDAPFAISSSGNAFLLHDRTGITQATEREIPLNDFPAFDDFSGSGTQVRGQVN